MYDKCSKKNKNKIFFFLFNSKMRNGTFKIFTKLHRKQFQLTFAWCFLNGVGKEWSCQNMHTVFVEEVQEFSLLRFLQL